MKKYPKIQSIFKRDETTHQFTEEYSRPEFEYLKDNEWIYTEKIDGMNSRISWFPDTATGPYVIIKGRTDKAQIPKFLNSTLIDLFPISKFEKFFPETPVTLYGEGYGARINKGGGKYIPDGVSFILFDVWIDGYWLKRESIEDIAAKLEIDIVPIVGYGNLHTAIESTKLGLLSSFGDFLMEGLVLKPKVGLIMQNNERVITKVKHRDFKK